MPDRNRWISRRWISALAAASLALVLPAATLAGHRDSAARHHGDRHRVEHPGSRDRYGAHDRRRPSDRYDAHDRYRHGSHHGHGPRWWGFAPRPRPYPVHVHGSSCGHRESAYGHHCRPCGHRYDSIALLHEHVHSVHHVPFWKLPFVIFAKAMGHYYYG
jgi:hypothetical protein